MSVPARPALLALILLVGCASANSSATASVGGGSTRSPSGTAATATPPGTATPTRLPALPAGFPVMEGMQVAGGAEDDAIARWRTVRNGAEVYSFYEDALQAVGYRIDLAGPGDSVAIFRFTPPDTPQLQLELYADTDGTRVLLRLPAP